MGPPALWCQVGLRDFIEGTGKDEEKAKEKGRNLLELVRASQSYKDAGRHRRDAKKTPRWKWD